MMALFIGDLLQSAAFSTESCTLIVIAITSTCGTMTVVADEELFSFCRQLVTHEERRSRPAHFGHMTLGVGMDEKLIHAWFQKTGIDRQTGIVPEIRVQIRQQGILFQDHVVDPAMGEILVLHVPHAGDGDQPDPIG